jgi:hypothetical protein
MTSRLWILLTFATIITLAGVSAAICFAVDPYGLWRDPTGRKLTAFDFERKAKFFLSRRYVPANFEGLIVGSSCSANWNVPSLAGERIYNESLPGGSVAEEQIVVNQALPRGHFKVAVIILWPTMTSHHDINEGLDTTRNVETLGSFHVYDNEVSSVLHAWHIRFHKSDAAPDGQVELPYRKRLWLPIPPDFFQIDPVALEDFRDIVQSLQNRGATIVYVVPPIYEPIYRPIKPAFEKYLDTVRQLLPSAPVIDLNGSEYTALRSDPDNYIDTVHLEPQGAAAVSALLQKLVPDAIASGK